MLAEVRREKCIMVGDYNFVIHREDVEENYRNKRSLELGQLVQAFSFCDASRLLHPLAVEYTFYRPRSSSARLDRMYVTQDMVQDVNEVVIMRVELAFTVPARTHKVGTWKLNCSILRDKDIQEPVEALLQEAQQDVAG